MNIKQYLKNPLKIVFALGYHGYLNWVPDPIYLRLVFKALTGRFMNLRNPKTFNEKLQWLKLYNRNPLYTTLVDKYAVKKWVADKIGEQYVIPTLGVWDRFEDIDFGNLPNQFVLKCTHDSGGLVIVKDKSKLDIEAARQKITKSLKLNYYWACREWPYKNVPPRIIAEKYMEDSTDGELRDYKFYTFKGEPKFLLIASNRQKGNVPYFDYFDMDGNHLDLHDLKTINNPNEIPQLPQRFNELKDLSRKLTKGIPHVRADFYVVNDDIFFGEYTFFDDGGFMKATPSSWEREWGEMIELPVKFGGRNGDH